MSRRRRLHLTSYMALSLLYMIMSQKPTKGTNKQKAKREKPKHQNVGMDYNYHKRHQMILSSFHFIFSLFIRPYNSQPSVI